jgi:hypothetical protein
MYEQRRRVQIGQMLCALLLRLAWWMQRIRKEQESSGKFRFFRAEHARLTSAVRMSAEKNLSGDLLLQRRDGILQSRAIMRRIARAGWSPGSHLPKRQIAAQHGESSRAQRLSHRDEERSLRISARTMGQYQPLVVGILWEVQKPPNARFGGIIDEGVRARRQELILSPRHRGMEVDTGLRRLLYAFQDLISQGVPDWGTLSRTTQTQSNES